MNGGGPLASPLRALRHAPVLVDDVGTHAPLVAAARAASADGLAGDADERARWTRAWLVACHGVLHERGAIGTVPPWTVPLTVAELPTLKGDPERRRLAAAVGLLAAASLITLSRDARVATFGPAAFVEHRAGLELDWSAICRVARHEPASLLVARALADLVVPSDLPTPVTLAELADRTSYAPKQVRTALRRLVEADVLRVSDSAGMAAQYCFGTVAVARPRAVVPVAAIEPPPAESSVGRTGATRAVALRLTLNGVTLSLGPGLAPHVELGPDGVPHLSFDPAPRRDDAV